MPTSRLLVSIMLGIAIGGVIALDVSYRLAVDGVGQAYKWPMAIVQKAYDR